MQFNDGILRILARKLTVISLVGGVCCLFCCSLCIGAAEDDLNRKAGELFTIAVQAERQGKNADAEKAYNDCLRFAKENALPKLEVSSLHRLAILKAKEQKFTESEKLFREAILRNNEDAAMLCDFAKLFSDQKKYTDAETILKNAVLAAPDNRRVLFSLGSVIALQNDRQTEGLRYLKLAIGEAAAYRELARIYRQNGNENQATFAEQRAVVLEKTKPEPSPESLTTPTISMDAQTKKELVDHIKEELLRLETSEIAEEQNSAPNTASKQQESAKFVDSRAQKSQSAQNPQTVPTNIVSTDKAVVPKPVADPFLTVEKPQTEIKKMEPQEEVSPISAAAPPMTAPLVHDPFFVPAVPDRAEVSFVQNPIKKEVAQSPKVVEQPKMIEQLKPVSQPVQQENVKILKPQPTTNEPIKTLPKFAQDHRNIKDVRTLPSTEYRISNSTDGEWEQSRQTELPALSIIPLEAPSTVKGIPAYTEIHKISTEDNTRPRFQTAPVKQPATNEMASNVPKDDAGTLLPTSEQPTTNENLNEIKPLKEDFSARQVLEQPVNLITLKSHRPANSPSNAPLPANESLKKTIDNRKIEEQKIEFSPSSVQNGNSIPQSNPRSTTSVLRPGAGKIEFNGNSESYVYVERNAGKENPNPASSESAKVASTSESVSEAASHSFTKPTAQPGSTSFSLMKPIPGRLANEAGNQASFPAPAQTPAAPTISVPKTASKKVATNFPTPSPWDSVVPNEQNVNDANRRIGHDVVSSTAPVIETTATPESQDEKRTDLQFSSLQAPTVLKFEIASSEKISEKTEKPADLIDRSNPPPPSNDNVFQPPTILKFGPAQSEVAVKPTPKPQPQTQPLPNKPLETGDHSMLKKTPSSEASVPNAAEKPVTKIAKTTNNVTNADAVPTDSKKPIPDSIVTATPTPVSASNPVKKTSPEPVPQPIAELKTEIAKAPAPPIPLQTEPQTPGNLESFFAAKESKLTQAEESMQAKPDTELPAKITNETAAQLTEKLTKQVTEQVTKQVTEQITKQVTEQVTKQVTEQVAKQVTEQVTKPIPEPTVRAFNEPIAEASNKPTVDPFNKSFTPLADSAAPVTESPNPQTEALVRSESPKFVIPNRPQSVPSIPEHPQPLPALPQEIVRNVEPKPAVEPVPVIEPKPALVVSEPVMLPIPKEEVVSKPVEKPAEIISAPIEIALKPSEPLPNLMVIPSKSESVLKALEQAQKPIQPLPIIAVQPTNLAQSEPQQPKVLAEKKIAKTLPKLKPEFDIAEKVAMNSLSHELLSNQPPVSEALKITEDETIGLAMTRRNRPAAAPPVVGEVVNDFLRPLENISENPIFSSDEKEDEENVGFARSGQYIKKNISKNTEHE